MTSKERVRATYSHKPVDRVPAAFQAVDSVKEKLLKYYGFTDFNQLIERFNIDIIYATPKYIGPPLKNYINSSGDKVVESYWGFEQTSHNTGIDVYDTTTYFPLTGIDTLEALEKIAFPNPNWFDYESIRKTCKKHSDKAIMIGREGVFQIVTRLMNMEDFFVLMIEEPEVAKRILKQINEFELEYYRRQFEAGEGCVDVLRVHDDYGTQISLLFSVNMWKEFFQDNTRKLVNLAHQYNAYYQQHSCGAIKSIIPELIACGVDALEPIQKVKGLELDTLADNYGGKIVFHGGIDTQQLLPNGTVDDVKAEAKAFIQTLGAKGGYVLMASQSFEGDVPIENIEAIYNVLRVIN